MKNAITFLSIFREFTGRGLLNKCFGGVNRIYKPEEERPASNLLMIECYLILRQEQHETAVDNSMPFVVKS